MTTDVLKRLRASPGTSGLFLDFDGTLAEIVPDPRDARLVEGATRVLTSLAAAFAVVAVVSGRRARPLAGRLGRPAGVRCFGLYGLEDETGPLDPEAAGMLENMERLLPALERAAASVPGARVEAKGFHASIHYRAAPDPEAARSVLLDSLTSAIDGTEMRLLEGKRVVEVAPERGPSKGDVVERVASEHGLTGILYAGDDLPDVEAFHAVTRRRQEGSVGITIAVRSEGTPDAVLEAADLAVGGPSSLVELLESLLSPR